MEHKTTLGEAMWGAAHGRGCNEKTSQRKEIDQHVCKHRPYLTMILNVTVCSASPLGG